MKTCRACEAKSGPRALRCGKCGATFGAAAAADDGEFNVAHLDDGGMLLLWDKTGEYLKFSRAAADVVERAMAKRGAAA